MRFRRTPRSSNAPERSRPSDPQVGSLPDSSTTSDRRGSEATERRRPVHVSLGGLMLVVTVLSAVGAAASYFVRSIDGPASSRLVFIVFCLLGPVILLLIVSLLYRLLIADRRR